jgi:hypothetical protein
MLGIRSTSLATYNSAPYDTIFARGAQAFLQKIFAVILFFPHSGQKKEPRKRLFERYAEARARRGIKCRARA